MEHLARLEHLERVSGDLTQIEDSADAHMRLMDLGYTEEDISNAG